MPSAGLAAALAEFRAQTSAAPTRPGAAAVKQQNTQKAAWHGRLYENLRNDVFDANPHQIRQRGGDKRKLRRNQYGFSVTGPVILPKIYSGKGKTFFTVTYEGVKESVGQFSMNTLPNIYERTGDWSKSVDSNGAPLPIYDPLTTAANPLYNSAQVISTSNLQYLRQTFVGNLIPLTRLDPVALRVLQNVPMPNTNAGPFFQNNYFAVTPEQNSANGFIISVDHSFLKKHRVTVRLNKSDGLNGNAANFPTAANSNNPNVNVLSRGIRIDHVYTASPTNVNTLRFSIDSQPNRNLAILDANGKPFPRYNFGAQNNFGGGGGGGGNFNNNNNNNNNFNNNNAGSGFYASWGQNNPISRDTNNNFVLNNNFASRWKRHRLALETEVQHRQINSFRPQSPEGRFDFTAGYTSLPGINNTGHPFASFLLGAASTVNQTIVISPSYYRWKNFRSTFSDTWQITKSLTVTWSANFQSFGQRTEKYDRQSNIDFTVLNPANGRPGALVAAGINGQPRNFPPRWYNVEPALGIAWSVLGNNNTVLRVNFSREYNGANTFNGHYGTQAFNGSQLYVSSNAQLAPALVLAEGLKPSRFPDLRPEAANGTSAQVWDVSGIEPSSMNYTVRLQRQLAKNLILTMNYNRVYGKNQFVNANLAAPNAIPLENLKYRDQLNSLTFSNSLRPFPQFQDFDTAQQFALGRFLNKNFSLQMEKRSTGGFALTTTYTRFIRFDNMTSPVQNPYDRMSGYTIATFSRPHQFDITSLYELPFGPGKQFLTSGLLGKHVFGGWAISGTSSIQGGNPLRITPTFNNTGGVIRSGALNVDIVPGVQAKVDNPTSFMWFNPAAFINPPDFTPGNGPRVDPVLRGPGSFNVDLTMNKRMTAGGDRTLEFTATMLNATNHANRNQPDTRIGSLAAPNFNAGKIIGSTGGRIIQLGLRLNF